MPNKQNQREEAAAVAAKKYIEDHPGTGISTAALAKMNDLSRNQLQKAFKKKYHKPIGKYKLKKRLEEGRRLLRTGQSVKEVAFKLGYASPSTFSDAFRNLFKTSPSEWLQASVYNDDK